ncbi:unnamed protein product [Mytilus coruscus]|uniref:Uncharacterized protein n=1 Tax=Mytilus coruscus TaxID=42192 RepID=A0A6J8AF11_MYTCO|nr:unnamed protein product [Mytilus coruscus]
MKIDLNPSKAENNDCTLDACRVFNCPFEYFSVLENRYCFSYNDVTSNDPNSKTDEIEGEETELFFNFGFPGVNGYTPGSVNGHQFRPPVVNAYMQPNKVHYNCRNDEKRFSRSTSKNGTACKEGTCRETDLIWECFLTVDHKLSMIYKGPNSPQAILLKPLNGRAVNYHTGQTYE